MQNDQGLLDDESYLKKMGYKQELNRRMSAFSNFAISLSIICILAGGLTSFHIGFNSVGGAAIGLGWPLACLFSLCVAASMGQLASAYPTAGGLYHWSAILGGRLWGWITAWFNLAGLITVLSAINVGMWSFTQNALKIYLGYDLFANNDPLLVQGFGVLLISILQATINHRGIQWTTRLTDLSGYLILSIALVLTVALLMSVEKFEPGRLLAFTNYSGSKGGDIWPYTDNLLFLFCLGLLLPAYTITGFDASAHTSEETLSAQHNTPKGIVRSVWVSGLLGWILLAAMVLAMPDLNAAALQGANLVFWLFEKTLPFHLNVLLLFGICIVQFLCGLATVTSASRMLFAFARDGGLPFSRMLANIDPIHASPSRAIWVVALLAWAFTLYTPMYSTITVVCAIFLYLSYVIPVVLGLWSHGRSWQEFGPWTLGRWFKPACLLSSIGCLILIWIGVQPPNDKALTVLLGTLTVMLLVWLSIERYRFKGPAVILNRE